MNIQSLGALVMGRKRQNLSEDEKLRRRNEIEQNKKIQKKETQRLYGLLQSQLSDRNAIDSDSFLNLFGHLNFFKEYIQEGNKQLVRQAFMKGDLQTFYKNQFITRKGEKNTHFMLILEGQVGLYLEVADQYRPSKKQLILIKKLIQGDTIEIGTHIDCQNFVMTTQAISETVQILCMNNQNFNKTFYKFESDKFDADLNFLKGVPFVADWPRKNLTALQMCISKYTVPRSQIIYQEGQPSHALFIVKKGEFGQYKKRQFWQRNENLEKGEVVDISEKFKRMEEESNKVGEDSPLSGTNADSQNTTPALKTLFRGASKADVTKKITGFLAGSVVEMNSDLIQTFTVFDSFGEKELLNNSPRQFSVVCKSNSGELIQIKARHFFILAQEDSELKFSMMTKMMVDYKKQEIQNMRSNLTFRNENELLLLDKNLNSIEDIEDKVNKFQSTGTIETAMGKNHPFNDSLYGNQSQSSKSIINKISFNPSNMGTLSSSNKQSTAHIYYEHRRQSKKLESSIEQQRTSNARASQVLQPQRQSILVTDLTQYLQKDLKNEPQTVQTSNQQSRRNIIINKSESLIPNHHSPIISQPKFIRDFTNSPSNSSHNKIDSLQDIESQDSHTLKLPIIKSGYSNQQNSQSAFTTKSQSLFHNGGSFSNAVDKGYGGSLTPNHTSQKFNFNLRKSFNFGGDNYEQPIKKPANIGKMSHLNTESGLPSNSYSSRPFINSINYSQYTVNI